ncbi:MAG: hypothetical protein HRU11_03565 [Parvularculaceae bacterium]|nr:hypothetical protein [Parvularculaceae bacterium]
MQTPLTFAIDNRLPEILERVGQLFPQRKARRQLSAMDQLIYGLIAHGLPASVAMASYRRLRMAFPSLADLKRARPGALQAELIGVPAAALKAAAIPELLATIEEAFGQLTLDGLERMETEQAHRFLTSLPRITDEIAASVLSFAGQERTVLSVDKDAARPLRRLGLCEPGAPLSALPRQLIERSPVEWRSEEFAGLSQGMLRVADRFCHQAKPDCANCPLRSLCPSAEEYAQPSATVVSFPFGKATQRARTSG